MDNIVVPCFLTHSVDAPNGRVLVHCKTYDFRDWVKGSAAQKGVDRYYTSYDVLLQKEMPFGVAM